MIQTIPTPTSIPSPAQGLPQSADSATSEIGRFFGGLLQMQVGGEIFWKIVTSVLVIAAVVVVRHLVLRVVERNVDEVRARYRWAKASAYAAFIVAAVFILAIWVGEFGSLGTFFGLLTAGLAIALKDPVTDLAGWMFIMWRSPFEVGDRVQIGEHAGDVVDIRLFQFSILEIGNWVAADQSTGRIIHIPNARVFNEDLANYTAQFEYLWNEIPVLVTFESDWRRAREIVREVADEHAAGVAEEASQAMKKASRKFLIFYPKLTPIVYTSVQDSGVLLTLRYLCEPRKRRGTAETIWVAILEAFAEEDSIDFAYPTHRTYFNPLEGKGGARAEPPAAWRSGDDGSVREEAGDAGSSTHEEAGEGNSSREEASAEGEAGHGEGQVRGEEGAAEREQGE